MVLYFAFRFVIDFVNFCKGSMTSLIIIFFFFCRWVLSCSCITSFYFFLRGGEVLFNNADIPGQY